MERYNKYLVLKIADIEKYLSDEKQLKLDALVTCIRVGRLNDGKRDQEYVCVAGGWPMYEQVWGMVEAFVDGKPNEIEQLQAKVAELEERRCEICGYAEHHREHTGCLRTQLTAAREEIDQLRQRVQELENQRDELLVVMTRCYKMLLSEPDTQGALFKAENILREAIADAN